jgi:hypothetical protein
LSLALLLLVLLAACGERDTPVGAAPAERPALENRWDSETGRGDVVHALPGGDLLRTCFHCKHAGYAGGLVIGNESGSGMGFYPAEPIRGFREINAWCAQDESIWDLDSEVEYTYGWSENIGTGPDGERLEYQGGRVLVDDGQRLVLGSTNIGGCYRVDKVASTRAGARWWVIATRITNTCEHPVRFDLYSGEDPWIGKYQSSEGDVGWTPEGFISHEAALGPGRFTVGGMVDLGTPGEVGQFSGQANFIALDPGTPPPDGVSFANRFAHGPDEVDPARPLDNQSLTAVNLVWRERTLAPGATFTMAFALGLAQTAEPGELPVAPMLDDGAWSAWRTHLPGEGHALRFAAERVDLALDAERLVVDGHYVIENPGDASMAVAIRYPVSIDADRPAPNAVEVDGRALKPSVGGDTAFVTFPIEVPPRSIRRFTVRYAQPHRGRSAEYMVTSARTWPTPIASAVFTIRHDQALGDVHVSLPTEVTIRGDEVLHIAALTNFSPEEELRIEW